jgi:hypothetical protein
MTARKKSAARKTPAPRAAGVAARLPKLGQVKATAARRKFVEGLVARGEAVPAGNALPRGATHEIVGKTEDGAPLVKRRRFSTR